MNNKQTIIIKLFSTQGRRGIKKKVYYSTLKKIAFAVFFGGVGGLRLKQLETVSFFRATKVRGS